MTDNEHRMTREMLGGLLTAAFRRGYTAGTKAVTDHEGCIPITKEAYLQLRDEAAKEYVTQLVGAIAEQMPELYTIR